VTIYLGGGLEHSSNANEQTNFGTIVTTRSNASFVVRESEVGEGHAVVMRFSEILFEFGSAVPADRCDWASLIVCASGSNTRNDPLLDRLRRPRFTLPENCD
jgi:hypothetical protein